MSYDYDSAVQLAAAAILDRCRRDLPWFTELEPAIRAVMLRHRWLTVHQAYELAAWARLEKTRDDGSA